ncbi:hypothetical protein AB0D29_22640 [Streptomyces sp. NPDC048424]|uniref:hypothetical protein n=1 Tax=Streptomyces sp. NPDC048424 TaxID=3155265 RepID=UPI00344735DE
MAEALRMYQQGAHKPRSFRYAVLFIVGITWWSLITKPVLKGAFNQPQIDTRAHTRDAAVYPALANLLLTIIERYVDGDLAALLDEEEVTDAKLGGVEPVRRRERLRLVAFILLTVAGSIGVVALGTPDAAQSPAIIADLPPSPGP